VSCAVDSQTQGSKASPITSTHVVAGHKAVTGTPRLEVFVSCRKRATGRCLHTARPQVRNLHRPPSSCWSRACGVWRGCIPAAARALRVPFAANQARDELQRARLVGLINRRSWVQIPPPPPPPSRESLRRAGQPARSVASEGGYIEGEVGVGKTTPWEEGTRAAGAEVDIVSCARGAIGGGPLVIAAASRLTSTTSA
jgi:hypothetical protein